MSEQKRCSVIYTVDDDPHATAVWIPLEMDNRFPGVTFCGSDRMEDAVKHAQAGGPPTLYVLDSRIDVSLKLLEECHAAIKEHAQIDIHEIAREHQYLIRGVYVGGLIRVSRQDCRVILLTAWLDKIRTIGGIDPLLNCACDAIVQKRGAHELIETIRRFVA